MRPLVALLFLTSFAFPSAVATPPTEPYEFSVEFSEPPLVGRSVEMTVTIHARVPLAARLRLETPPWVAVDEPREWDAKAAEGSSVSQAFTVMPTQAGFWHAGFSFEQEPDTAYGNPIDPSAARHPMPGCCAYVMSLHEEARHHAQLHAFELPIAVVNSTWSVRALDAERAELALTLRPMSGWLRHAQFQLQYIAVEDDIRYAPADGPQSFPRAFPLRDGNSTVVSGSWSIRAVFERAQIYEDREIFAAYRGVGCENAFVARAGDDVRMTLQEPCNVASVRRPVPTPSPALVLAVAPALARAVRGRRKR